MLFLGGGDVDGDVDLDHDTEIDGGEGLNLLSLKSILAFLTGFGGAGGTAAYYNLPHLIAVPTGLGAGFLLALVTAYFMKFLRTQQTNSSLSLNLAEGKTGVLSRRIPLGGVGRVKLKVNDESLERDARLEDPNGELPVGSEVEIVIAGGSHFTVRLKSNRNNASAQATQNLERGVKD
jgi:membrane protein implicated in regulation of membrane protease activity